MSFMISYKAYILNWLSRNSKLEGSSSPSLSLKISIGILSDCKNEIIPRREKLFASRDSKESCQSLDSPSTAWAGCGFSRYMLVNSLIDSSPSYISPAICDRAKACPLSFSESVCADVLSDARSRPILFFRRKSKNSAPVLTSHEVISIPDCAGSYASEWFLVVMMALPWFVARGQYGRSVLEDSTLSKMTSHLHSGTVKIS